MIIEKCTVCKAEVIFADSMIQGTIAFDAESKKIYTLESFDKLTIAQAMNGYQQHICKKKKGNN